MDRSREGRSRRLDVALGALTLVVLGFVLVRYFVWMQVTIPDEGMVPVLQRGDRVLVDRLVDDYEVGDLVVFGRGERFFVRRVVGVAGDLVGLEGGAVVSNGVPAELQERGVEIYTGYEQDEDGGRRAVERSCGRWLESVGFASHTICLAAGPDARPMSQEAVVVPPGRLHVLCDNRFDCAADSRDMGPVARGALRGRVTHLMARSGVSGASWWEQVVGLWEEL